MLATFRRMPSVLETSHQPIRISLEPTYALCMSDLLGLPDWQLGSIQPTLFYARTILTWPPDTAQQHLFRNTRPDLKIYKMEGCSPG